MMKKYIATGLGETNSSFLKLFSKYDTIVRYDLNKKLINKKSLKK
jgi:hypothetical protein|tara:strand:- start:1204 stop:1338 length:135 start_codon:yes stop_codon:yes gene_type:complete